MNDPFHLVPQRASSMAGAVDHVFFTVLGITGVTALAVTATIIVLCIRFRRGSRAERSPPPTRHRGLELAWTILPLLVFLGIFLWAAKVYSDFFRVPPDAIPIFVVARQWMWQAQHDNGRREIDELHLALGQPVRLLMTSQDVIHSFYVPAFRLKRDVVPGRYQTLWFTPTELGEFYLLCAEYCGTEHARMRGRIIVLSPSEYARWLAASQPAPGMAARGAELYRQHGCSGCHDPPSTVHAPRLAGLYGRQVHLQDGRTVVADEAYLRDSILQPGKEVVAGFASIMPSYQGQIGEDELLQLLAYLQSLKEAQ